MSWHGGRKGGSWGTVKFLCQCPSLTLFLLLAHHVLFLIYDSFMHYHLKFLGERNVSIQRESLSAKMKKNPRAKYNKESLPCSPSSLSGATFAFWAWAKFQSKHHNQCGGTSPKAPCVRWGEKRRLACRCVWLSAGLWLVVCLHQGVILPFLGDAVCICPSQGCAGIALLVAVGSVCACVYLEVCLCVCLCVFASQPCWWLQKETWQRDDTIRWEQSTGEGVMHIRQLVLEKAWKKFCWRN